MNLMRMNNIKNRKGRMWKGKVFEKILLGEEVKGLKQTIIQIKQEYDNITKDFYSLSKQTDKTKSQFTQKLVQKNKELKHKRRQYQEALNYISQQQTNGQQLYNNSTINELSQTNQQLITQNQQLNRTISKLKGDLDDVKKAHQEALIEADMLSRNLEQQQLLCESTKNQREDISQELERVIRIEEQQFQQRITLLRSLKDELTDTKQRSLLNLRRYNY
ncbi:unnamed protein product [Paramecium sonneborni]|uniref:Uncharacterized protein n=1 Tax=Paramecium sonneborni TaxID=65129 RepID=A0A8S1RS30_9CILI|nr:unnamed protein product [Paramecium sonneborni]